jgi:hypothetical protein
MRLKLAEEHGIIIEENLIGDQVRFICLYEHPEAIDNPEILKKSLIQRIQLLRIMYVIGSKKPQNSQQEEIRERFSNALEAFQSAGKALRGSKSSTPPKSTVLNKSEIFGISLSSFINIHKKVKRHASESGAVFFIQDLALELSKCGMIFPEYDIKTALFDISLDLSREYGMNEAQNIIRNKPEQLWELLIEQLR